MCLLLFLPIIYFGAHPAIFRGYHCWCWIGGTMKCHIEIGSATNKASTLPALLSLQSIYYKLFQGKFLHLCIPQDSKSKIFCVKFKINSIFHKKLILFCFVWGIMPCVLRDCFCFFNQRSILVVITNYLGPVDWTHVGYMQNKCFIMYYLSDIYYNYYWNFQTTAIQN